MTDIQTLRNFTSIRNFSCNNMSTGDIARFRPRHVNHAIAFGMFPTLELPTISIWPLPRLFTHLRVKAALIRAILGT